MFYKHTNKSSETSFSPICSRRQYILSSNLTPHIDLTPSPTTTDHAHTTHDITHNHPSHITLNPHTPSFDLPTQSNNIVPVIKSSRLIKPPNYLQDYHYSLLTCILLLLIIIKQVLLYTLCILLCHMIIYLLVIDVSILNYLLLLNLLSTLRP